MNTPKGRKTLTENHRPSTSQGLSRWLTPYPCKNSQLQKIQPIKVQKALAKLEEAQGPTSSLTTSKITLHNVRTMHSAGNAAQMVWEMESYKLYILGIRETRWTGSGGIKLTTGSTLYCMPERSTSIKK